MKKENSPIFRKIGDTFITDIHGEKTIVVVYPEPRQYKASSCEGCVFFRGIGEYCSGNSDDLGECEAPKRPDHTGIIYKKVFPSQFRIMQNYICTQALQWVKDHPKSDLKQGIYTITKNLYPIESAIIRNSQCSILHNSNNINVFWDRLKQLIMKPLTVKDLIDYLKTLPEDYEIHYSDEGAPITLTDSKVDHQNNFVELQFD